VYDLLLVIMRMSSEELWLQLLAVAIAMLAIPFIAGLIEGMLEKAADAIKEFIVS
jgi:cell shape-determining protein MreD